MAKILRQGDVAVILDAGARRPGQKKAPRDGGRVVLAYGEVTGHSHAIESRDCSLYLDDAAPSAPDAMQILARLGGGQTGALIPDKVLSARRPVSLKHEEHGTVRIPAGDHVVRIQREYAPGELRNVAD